MRTAHTRGLEAIGLTITRRWAGKTAVIATVANRLPWHEDRNCEADETYANAALFAAADDMFEALKGLSAVAETTTFSDQYPAECEAARTAISKALGVLDEGGR